MQNDKHVSERKILSMQSQVNFLLGKEADETAVKLTEKMSKELKKTERQENACRERRASMAKSKGRTARRGSVR
jgi:hypothetical protein